MFARAAGSLIDLDLTAAPPPKSTKERATAALQTAEAALKAKPDDLNARLARASAHFHLGENQKAIDDLNAVIEKSRQQTLPISTEPSPMPGWVTRTRRWRIWSGSRKEMLPRARSSTSLSSWRRNWERELTKRLRRSKRRSRSNPRIRLCPTMRPVPTPWHFRLLRGRTKRRGMSCERAIHLLRTAIENGYTDYKQMQERADLDPIRKLPAFAEVMKAGILDRSYTAVWAGDVPFEPSPFSVLSRLLTSSAAGNWRHRAIAWFPCQ